jgi:hypothetical protein
MMRYKREKKIDREAVAQDIKDIAELLGIDLNKVKEEEEKREEV